MKKGLKQWLIQGRIRKVIDELIKQYSDNQRVILISIRYHKYLEDYHDGVNAQSESNLTYNNICRDLSRLIEEIDSDVPTQSEVTVYRVAPEVAYRSGEFQLKIEAYYQIIQKVNCRIKALNLSKRETQNWVKFLSAQIALLYLGTEIPPPYLDKPSMPPNTIICCNLCRDNIQLEGNDQCSNCKLSTYAWM